MAASFRPLGFLDLGVLGMASINVGNGIGVHSLQAKVECPVLGVGCLARAHYLVHVWRKRGSSLFECTCTVDSFCKRVTMYYGCVCILFSGSMWSGLVGSHLYQG